MGGCQRCRRRRPQTEVPIKSELVAILVARVCRFHRIASNQPLPTDETAVKEFLIKLREQGKAAWQRLQVLRYIINYTKDHLHLDTQALEAMASKLDSLARREKFSQLTNVNDRAGIIATNEPLIVQELRKCIRVEAKKLTTEKAYVKWIKRFANASNCRLNRSGSCFSSN